LRANAAPDLQRNRVSETSPVLGPANATFTPKAYERERSARRRAATKGVYKKKVWAMRQKQAFESDPQCAWVLNDGTRLSAAR
jgi:hypothetical protein